MLKQLQNLHKPFIRNILSKALIVVLSVMVLFFSIIYSVNFGAMGIAFDRTQDILLYNLGFDIPVYWTKTQGMIIWSLRFPRAILACLAGAGLAVAGVAMQAAVKNPLADPYVLGISAGASAGATLVIAADIMDVTAEYSIALGAFLGASASMLLLFLLNKNGKDSVRLLLSGCVISILFSSVSSVVMFMAKDQEKVSSVVFWLMGSVSDANWNMLPLVTVPVLFCLILLMIYHRELDAMLLGEETAQTLGVDARKRRWQLVLLVSFIVGAIVAFCGMIGFVGFVIPHIVRSLFGSSHRVVVPVSAFIGAFFLLWCDVLARTVVVPEELPIGIITSICGAPFFIYILQRKKAV